MGYFLILNTGFAHTDFDGPREIFIISGTNGLKNQMGTLENFRKLQPNASLLVPVTGNNYFTDERSDNSLFIFGFGFKPKTNGPTYRFAMGGGFSSNMLATYSTASYFRYDTLTSSMTGQQSFIDSAVFEKYRFEYNASLVTLDISAIWHTKNPNKMKFFAGIGSSYGTAYGTSKLSYRKYSYINTYPRARYNDEINVSETHEQKRQFMFAVYSPFGVDYKLSKTSKFWEKLHLFIESRAQLYYQEIPELGKFIRGRMQIGLGLRVMFDE